MDERLELEAEIAALLQAQAPKEDADRWTLACIQEIY